MTNETAYIAAQKEQEANGTSREAETGAGQDGVQNGAQPEVAKTKWRPFQDIRSEIGGESTSKTSEIFCSKFYGFGCDRLGWNLLDLRFNLRFYCWR